MNRYRQHDEDPDVQIRRMWRMTLSWLLVTGLLLGTVLPAGAATGYSNSQRTSGRGITISDRIRSKSPDVAGSTNQKTLQGQQSKNNEVSLKQAKQIMNQKLTSSNRLNQEIGDMKKKTGKLVETARNRVKQIVKNSENLSGEQILALKDVVLQIKQYRDNVGAQERRIMVILKQLHDLRAGDQFADSISVLDELVAAQKKLIEIMKNSGTVVGRIGTILKS